VWKNKKERQSRPYHGGNSPTFKYTRRRFNVKGKLRIQNQSITNVNTISANLKRGMGKTLGVKKTI